MGSHRCIVYFSTCFDFDPRAGDGDDFAGRESDDVYVEMLKRVFESFQKNRQFYQRSFIKVQTCFFAVTATDI